MITLKNYTLTTQGAIVLGAVASALIIAIGISCASPRYEILAIANSSNPAVWKLDRFNGDVFLCATPGSKDAESGCSAKMKQF